MIRKHLIPNGFSLLGAILTNVICAWLLSI
jgi:hypothetical protein